MHVAEGVGMCLLAWKYWKLGCDLGARNHIYLSGKSTSNFRMRWKTNILI